MIQMHFWMSAKKLETELMNFRKSWKRYDDSGNHRYTR